MALPCHLVSIKVSSEVPWLEKPPQTGYLHQSFPTPHVKVLSGDGFCVSLPLPLLLASSSLLRSILSSGQCCGSVDISIPSVGGGTLVLLTEILRRGETSSLERADNAVESLKEVQGVLDMLLCDASVTLKRKSSRQSQAKKVVSESMNEIRQVNNTSDVGFNGVGIKSPFTPSVIVSPSHSDSSSITLSPSDLKQEEQKPSPANVLYIDVNLTDIISSPKQRLKEELECSELSLSMKPKKEKVKDEHESGKVVLCCPFCQRVFKNEKSLKQHIELLHPEPNYSCIKCDSSFFNKSRLEKHIRLFHPKYKCKKCSVSFSSKLKLSHHVRNKHEDSVQCTDCDDRFTSEGKLAVHMNSSHAKYNCEDCPAKLGSFHILLEHLELKHKDVRFSCNVCHKIFKTNHNFMRHCVKTSHDPKLMTKFKIP